MAALRIYHSFRSPYSRLGLHKIARAEIEAELIPFTGPPEGVPFNDPLQNAPKLAYYMQDAPRMTMRMGLAIRPPNPFEIDFTAANKALIAASRDGKGLAFALCVADARWGEGKNISQIDVLEECARQCDWDAGKVGAAQNDAEISNELEKQRALIEKDGVFGVPFAVCGDSKYWGHERFDLLIEDLSA